jgi:predicted esterase
MAVITPRRGALLALVLGAAGCSPAASGMDPARLDDGVTRSAAMATSAPRADEGRAAATAPEDPPGDDLPRSPEAAPAPTPTPEPQAPAPVTLRVPADKTVQVLHGVPGDPGRQVLVYLHGRCGDVHAFRSWASAAMAHGTLIALLGDVRCKGSTRFRWGDDVGQIHRRILAAIGAVGAARGEPLNTASLTVIGYSEGALKAEALVRRYPSIYRRALLIAGPRAPASDSLKARGAAVIIAGARDRRDHLREAARGMERSGQLVTYMELPEARHGDYGPEGARVMGEALRWVSDKAP